MEASLDQGVAQARNRRASVVAIAAPPVTMFIAVLALGLVFGPREAAPFGAFLFSGFSLCGPFAHHMAEVEGVWWHSPTLAWLLMISWAVAARYTFVGNLHWVLHGAIVVIWMMVGFIGHMLVAMRT